MALSDATIIKVEDEPLMNLLKRVKEKVENMKPAFSEIGQMLIASVEKNFASEGRWSGIVGSYLGGSQKWANLKPSTLARRFKEKHDGPILQVSGQLAASITPMATKDSVEIGTNKEYAKVHQFGATKGELGEFVQVWVKEHVRRIFGLTKKGKASKKATGKATVSEHMRTIPAIPWGDVPARPFLVVQEEDFTKMFDILSKYLVD